MIYFNNYRLHFPDTIVQKQAMNLRNKLTRKLQN